MTLKGTVDLQHLIDSRRFSPYQWLVLALCFLIVVMDGFDTAAIGYIAPSLIADWGISRPALAPVVSAALFGLAVGAIFAGPLADRFGRRMVLIVSVLFFGGWNLATAMADSVQTLTAYRFATGLGLGAAMSNGLTLIAEYAPSQRRALLMSVVFCGFPAGAALGGLFASWLIPSHGWRSVLLVGGWAPLALSVFLLFWLPESVRYMLLSGKPMEKVFRTVARVMQDPLQGIQKIVCMEDKPVTGGSAIGQILSSKYRLGSLMLWLTYFMGLLIFYVLTGWMPLLMKDAGFSTSKAALLTALFPLGGAIGTVIAGWLMDKLNPRRVVMTTFLLTGILLFSVGQVHALGLLSLLIFLAGGTMNAGQTSMGYLAADFYPTQCRATGMSWMLGFGRFGGISGALLGAELMSLQLGFSGFFGLLAIPALIAVLALAVLQGLYARRAVGKVVMSEG
ncbi:MFS transporter [Chromobacterium piscinae]|uniref:MFS transporter n=1 Tax=Chromobacterium piscinae TaxID=686831 RepID=A0ABV0H7M5_9NEIS|nr:MFS transporter [Chromobacterium piscinae]MBX9296622.1 MFS transporter [Chromobacterium vaccinii]MBX9348552.1 MFS transporter [Chromobacterium vaccinii]MBX9359535.1 MFS transporter [Chromobacterium vaccinii]MCD4504917.1 MFS transporter [Chromobacterium piscinae]MCD5327689.1 MFS transporter [Chromobacterium piscinae]